MHNGTGSPEMPDSPESPRDGSGAMFDRIAARYDLLNRVLSLGLDRGWRRAATKALQPPANSRILDVATGTGDLALAILRRYPTSTVDGLDPSGNMLALADRKAANRKVDARYTSHVGDAQALPFADATFDGATIAFGIRNVPDRLKGLQEMARVVKPGGRVVVLELTEPRSRMPWGLAARLWVHQIVRRLGAWLSRSHEYRYLQRSIEAFPPPAEFAGLMREAGLVEVTVRSLGLGSVALFVGVVPQAVGAVPRAVAAVPQA